LWSKDYYSGTLTSVLYRVIKLGNGEYVASGRNYAGNMLLMKFQEPLYCCDVDMYPDEEPLIVQPGGSFRFTGHLINPSTEPLVSDVWTGVIYEGEYFETRVWEGTDSIPPGHIITRHPTQNVPNYAPPGEYQYIAYAGAYPYPCDSVSFPFTVAGARIADGANEWSFEGEFFGDTVAPSEYGLRGNYPNPFNASTNINFSLPEAGNVSLEVYNLLGQKVATLVNGYVEAGQNTVTWDASYQASGVYFYKLSAGEKVFTRRMTLLK
ncbi:MAG: T9SS type A sorting domain-containing protein, partial [candidate division Zixibacteria bacterium]|nr:T9SS type A sorting domain-containing protein [candidate division Zixibacteria bacterium]